MNFLASLVGKLVHKRMIENGATSQLSKTVGSAVISDFLKAHSRVRLNTKYFLVLTKLKFDIKLVKNVKKSVSTESIANFLTAKSELLATNARTHKQDLDSLVTLKFERFK